MTFLFGLTYFLILKGRRVIRCRRDLVYDPKGNGDLCGQFEVVYGSNIKGSFEVTVIYFMTPKVTAICLVSLT